MDHKVVGMPGQQLVDGDNQSSLVLCCSIVCTLALNTGSID